MITIRKMEAHEAKTVKKIAVNAFSFIEGLFISKPKEAMVALIDDQIVGGIIIKYIHSGDQLVGYFDGAFIEPNVQGQGIGKALYEKTTQYLWEQGCTAQTALVKDDNVGSWKLFLENGFNLSTLRDGVHQLGGITMLKQYFLTPLCISNGMEFYLVMKEKTVSAKPVKSFKQIIAYLVINMFLMLLAYQGGLINFLTGLSAYFLLLVGGLTAEYLGTLCSKREWQFRLNSGGAMMVGFINLIGGIFPMIGRWYPKEYEQTTAFKKDLAISATFEWVFMILITTVALFNGTQGLFLKQLLNLGIIFLIYHVLCFYPFESYGGQRVFNYHKGLYSMMTIVSFLLILIASTY